MFRGCTDFLRASEAFIRHLNIQLTGKFLIPRYNADPLIRDNDGTSPMMMCLLKPHLRTILKVGERKVIDKERQTAKIEKNFKVDFLYESFFH